MCEREPKSFVPLAPTSKHCDFILSAAPPRDHIHDFHSACILFTHLQRQEHIAESATCTRQLATIAVLRVVRNSGRTSSRGGRVDRSIGGRRGSCLVSGSGSARVTASPDGRAGHGVRLVSAPEGEVDLGIVDLVHAWDLRGRARDARATLYDLDLSATVTG